MKAFVQFALDSRHPERARNQRDRFHEWVSQRGDPARDQVVLVEPNPWLAQRLRDRWSGWSNVTVLEASTLVAINHPSDATPTDTVRYYQASSDAPEYHSMGPVASSVRRRFPHSDVKTTMLPRVSIADVLELTQAHAITLVAVDGLGPDLAGLAACPTLAQVGAVAVSWNVPPRAPQIPQPESLFRLRQHGLVASGSAWGESGETSLLSRPTSLAARVQASGAETRMRIGQAWVKVRDNTLGPAKRARARQRVCMAINSNHGPGDVLDPDAGQALEPLIPDQVEALLPEWDLLPARELHVPQPWVDDPWSLAQECRERHGVWPISFSYPREPHPVVDRPELLISLVTPGFPYTFNDERAYLQAYARAYWGVTHRKAGWDCFRHVEILASGAVPLMIDAEAVPRFSMVHYPKQAMTQALEQFTVEPGKPNGETRKSFREFFNQHLTSKAMAEYLLRAAGMAGARRVLFVDQRLPHHADYQSVLTLVGLKQVLGQHCTVMYPVDYIYEDTAAETSALYGRGFGYTRVLPASSRSDFERAGHQGRNPAMGLDDFDAVIVGSVSRNEEIAADLLRRFPADRTVWIYGEDTPPSVEEVVRYRKSGVHVFVRAIHSAG